ncbi:PREDICTED: receptor expression-enhancing protein 2-like [Prunus mume]|uniref:HVA22-like protein n=1 Tax=Prunus mume TaxID=102107 RepID=A0ABM1LTQ1_PRUMU|nr:PREDICTED: receptor expression-enhancing protein 2-like [Prunus mume]
MDFVGLVQFSLQCFDVLAWPLLSLVYPICYSIRAIEANSVSDFQKLNTYWVVFSLILLFEHAFMKLLKWLPLWPYFRLIIVFWLVIPHFGGAFYVYKHLQIVVNWFNKRKKSSFNSDNVYTEVERYAQEKGPVALEKVVASKSERTKSNPDAKEFKAVSSLENKEVSQAEPNLTGTENSRFPSTDIKEEAIGIASEIEVLNIPPLEKVQEWTSAVSQVTTQSDTSFNSYPDGKVHDAVYEKPKIQNKAEAKLSQMETGTFATRETRYEKEQSKVRFVMKKKFIWRLKTQIFRRKTINYLHSTMHGLSPMGKSPGSMDQQGKPSMHGLSPQP